MAEVFDRDAKEAALAREVSGEFSRVRTVLFFEILNMSGKKQIPASVWKEHRKDIAEAVEPVMRRIYWAQTQTMVQNGG